MQDFKPFLLRITLNFTQGCCNLTNPINCEDVFELSRKKIIMAIVNIKKHVNISNKNQSQRPITPKYFDISN